MTKHFAERRPITRLAFSRAELALSIGVSPPSVDAMVAEGVLPPPRKWRSRKLWIVSEVEAYLNELPSEGESHREAAFGKREDSYVEALPHIAVGSGGYPIASNHSHQLQKYYDQLGFDPTMINSDDIHRLRAAADERWKKSIPGTPLGKRERSALDQMAKYPTGETIKAFLIKNCGSYTSERLEARGYVKVVHEGDALIGYILTSDGLKAAQQPP